MKNPVASVFRSLSIYNYKVWAAGALVSNIGTWMQRTAQDWLVLTQLTHHNASAVGITMALQFGPQLLLLPWTGFAADHFDQRKLVIVTQASMGVLALALGILTVTGRVTLWEVYVFALLLGCASAFDAPVRQVFVSDLVPETHLPNAVALNSASFNGARMVGPAVAGLVIAGIGTGWAFLMNAVSFLAVLASLFLLRRSELRAMARVQKARGNFKEGLRYVWSRPDLFAILVMLFLIGTFGLNFPIYISTMTVRAFHTGARSYGVLSSMMAIGTVSGAFLNASGDRPRFRSLAIASAVFGIGCSLAAVSPGFWLFGGALILTGVAASSFINATNSLMQLSSEPSMRGRVLALRIGVAMGGTPIGAPTVGWVVDHFGPRWAMGVGASSGVLAAVVGVYALMRRFDRVKAKAGK